MRVSISDVIRAVEKILAEFGESPTRQSASLFSPSSGLVIQAIRMEKTGHDVPGLSHQVGGRKWIELRIEVDE